MTSPIDEEKINRLKRIANEIRKDVITMVYRAGSGHVGGSLSAVEIVTALYFHKMVHDPSNPFWKERDKFILSKGHAAPLLYAVLARCGYFPKEELFTLRMLNSRLQGHPSMGSPPGVEVSSGSLGQGLSIAAGIALAAKLDKLRSRIYVLLGDGEMQEGQVWEAANAIAHHKIDNLCAIIDKNRYQLDGKVEDIMSIDPLEEKFRSFRWNVFMIDGHNFKEIIHSLDEAEKVRGIPTVIIANTIKGKGAKVFENNNKFHGTPPTEEEYIQAMKELEEEQWGN